MQEMGNSRARAVYEANVPDTFRRPQTDSYPYFLKNYLQGKYDLIIYADLITVVVSGELVMSLFYCAGIAVKMYCVNLFSACQVNTLSGTMLNFQCQPSEFSVGHSVCLPLCQCSCALWYC